MTIITWSCFVYVFGCGIFWYVVDKSINRLIKAFSVTYIHLYDKGLRITSWLIDVLIDTWWLRHKHVESRQKKQPCRESKDTHMPRNTHIQINKNANHSSKFVAPSWLKFTMALYGAEAVKANTYIRQEIKASGRHNLRHIWLLCGRPPPQELHPPAKWIGNRCAEQKEALDATRHFQKGLDQNTLWVLKAVSEMYAGSLQYSIHPQPPHAWKIMRTVSFCRGCSLMLNSYCYCRWVKLSSLITNVYVSWFFLYWWILKLILQQGFESVFPLHVKYCRTCLKMLLVTANSIYLCFRQNRYWSLEKQSQSKHWFWITTEEQAHILTNA